MADTSLTTEQMVKAIKEEFVKQFGELGDAKVYFAPGRVNLIGEHTDYNGGHVFPCALTIGTYACARLREDRQLNFYSMNLSRFGMVKTSLDELVPDDKFGWTNYPKGVIYTFLQKNFPVDKGMDVIYYGNIPAGSGLSSSASIEVLTGFMLRDLFGFELNNIMLALIGQESENKYNGMNCGIMDQFASAMGKKDHAIFLNTADLSYEYVPINLDGMSIVLSNTNKKHKLTDSAYNTRRLECEQALSELQKVVNIETLGDLTDEEFEKYQDAIKDDDRRKRAKHAVYENQRTIEAVRVLKEGNVERFGQLMNEAHVSIRDDFEVSCKELDILAEDAWNTPGVIGSRMTGGGFGGCTVSIVKNDAIDNFVRTIGADYKKKVGYSASFYIVGIGDGPKVVG